MAVKLPSERRKARSKSERHRQKFWFDQGDIARDQHLATCESCMAWQVDRMSAQRVRGWQEAQAELFAAKRVIEGWRFRS